MSQRHGWACSSCAVVNDLSSAVCRYCGVRSPIVYLSSKPRHEPPAVRSPAGARETSGFRAHRAYRPTADDLVCTARALQGGVLPKKAGPPSPALPCSSHAFSHASSVSLALTHDGRDGPACAATPSSARDARRPAVAAYDAHRLLCSPPPAPLGGGDGRGTPAPLRAQSFSTSAAGGFPGGGLSRPGSSAAPSVVFDGPPQDSGSRHLVHPAFSTSGAQAGGFFSRPGSSAAAPSGVFDGPPQDSGSRQLVHPAFSTGGAQPGAAGGGFPGGQAGGFLSRPGSSAAAPSVVFDAPLQDSGSRQLVHPAFSTSGAQPGAAGSFPGGQAGGFFSRPGSSLAPSVVFDAPLQDSGSRQLVHPAFSTGGVQPGAAGGGFPGGQAGGFSRPGSSAVPSVVFEGPPQDSDSRLLVHPASCPAAIGRYEPTEASGRPPFSDAADAVRLQPLHPSLNPVRRSLATETSGQRAPRPAGDPQLPQLLPGAPCRSRGRGPASTQRFTAVPGGRSEGEQWNAKRPPPAATPHDSAGSGGEAAGGAERRVLSERSELGVGRFPAGDRSALCSKPGRAASSARSTTVEHPSGRSNLDETTARRAHGGMYSSCEAPAHATPDEVTNSMHSARHHPSGRSNLDETTARSEHGGMYSSCEAPAHSKPDEVTDSVHSARHHPSGRSNLDETTSSCANGVMYFSREATARSRPDGATISMRSTKHHPSGRSKLDVATTAGSSTHSVMHFQSGVPVHSKPDEVANSMHSTKHHPSGSSNLDETARSAHNVVYFPCEARAHSKHDEVTNSMHNTKHHPSGRSNLDEPARSAHGVMYFPCEAPAHSKHDEVTNSMHSTKHHPSGRCKFDEALASTHGAKHLRPEGKSGGHPNLESPAASDRHRPPPAHGAAAPPTFPGAGLRAVYSGGEPAFGYRCPTPTPLHPLPLQDDPPAQPPGACRSAAAEGRGCVVADSGTIELYADTPSSAGARRPFGELPVNGMGSDGKGGGDWLEAACARISEEDKSRSLASGGSSYWDEPPSRILAATPEPAAPRKRPANGRTSGAVQLRPLPAAAHQHPRKSGEDPNPVPRQGFCGAAEEEEEVVVILDDSGHEQLGRAGMHTQAPLLVLREGSPCGASDDVEEPHFGSPTASDWQRRRAVAQLCQQIADGDASSCSPSGLSECSMRRALQYIGAQPCVPPLVYDLK
ncbi:hypothetical protein DIPPA_14702 [Diplonema papillatum]|nr:hypothetical protein DIPPA_14702 [Diplonema papillatum]